MQYWIVRKPARMHHMVMNETMLLSDQPRDSEQDLRWLAWQKKNRLEDRIAEKRMKAFFVVVFAILLTWMVYALTQAGRQTDLAEKGPTVACRWPTAALRYS